MMLEFFAKRTHNKTDVIAVLVLVLVGDKDGVIYGVIWWVALTFVSVVAELVYEKRIGHSQ